MLFRDFGQKALKEGRLLFREKPKASVQVDFDPLQVKEAHFSKPVKIPMVEATEGLDFKVEQVEQNTAEDIAEKMKVVFLQEKEELI